MDSSVSQKKKAFYFVLLMGLVSLFSDITYEGARSLVGPYLGLLGASAVVVSAIAGFGELLGYTLRFVTGRLVDKTRKYWFFATFGYAMNLFVIPTLALTKHWYAAAVLIILERVGKAFRKPAKDTITSFAGSHLGYGTTFAIEEFLDQIGATIGPLIMSITVAQNIKLETADAYRKAFGFLLFPALITMGIIFIARTLVPEPEKMEKSQDKVRSAKFDKSFHLYLISISLIAFGFADFALIGFHAQKNNILSPALIPLAYMTAMIVDAFAGLIFGRLFDRFGIVIMSVASFITSFYAIFSFGMTKEAIFLGAVLWGIGMGANESIMKATVAKLVSSEVRGTAYGFFNAIFGIAWFIGSAVLGFLYALNRYYLMYVASLTQILAAVLLLYLSVMAKRKSST
ncbi:MFS transporter [Fervidobacterium islandicum]|uniref:MFS transporter n=1 Tax=Fervidobacterium islandicum TaxID=2423 RepID=UPI003A7309FB